MREENLFLQKGMFLIYGVGEKLSKKYCAYENKVIDGGC